MCEQASAGATVSGADAPPASSTTPGESSGRLSVPVVSGDETMTDAQRTILQEESNVVTFVLNDPCIAVASPDPTKQMKLVSEFAGYVSLFL